MSAESAAFEHINDYRWRQGDPSMSDAEARMLDLRALLEAVEDVTEIAVADARVDGLTWSQISGALGISQRAAANRFGRGGAR